MNLSHSFALSALGLMLVFEPGAIAQGEQYPARPITLIVPWPAGGAQDALGRMIAPKLADRVGGRMIVENRPGAGSVIGVAAGARAAPNGYTLVQLGAAFAINATVHRKLPYDPVKDFAPIALVAQVPFVLVVHPSLPARSAAELIELAKTRPLSYASAGPGSPHHLCAELFKSITGIEMTHIPYKGSPPAVADVVAGHVPIHFSDPVASLPLIREGKLRALGVTTGTRMLSALEIPTIGETGVPEFEAASWIMIAAPVTTPKEIVARLHGELRSIAQSADISQQIVSLGMIPVSSPPPEALRGFVSSEITRWARAVHQAGLAASE